MPALATVTYPLLALVLFDQPLPDRSAQGLGARNDVNGTSVTSPTYSGSAIQCIIGKLAIESGACGHADMVKQERIAIRVRGCDAPRASVPAPPTFSTMTCWPRSWTWIPRTRRVTVSGPPAAKGTTTVIVRSDSFVPVR